MGGVARRGIYDNMKTAVDRVPGRGNAFAHGKVLHELSGGYLLLYYSGGVQELVLDDLFFEKVESTVRNCLYACNGVIQATQAET